ncbi:DUF262 domain-containing protein [Ancylothrix sp. C2]|uniref:DUF262 domain-containing protein n=1 Tax=Ancylothrix sp. D3o TaxID=2953691 RepID=UPI0021BA4CBC|nr:DUF262 domain-containing protein [Ancylothrix sp. D3o]MCT7950145.1 DUF262 domain-containing protein [Ancylothrix sp. D3o]
MIRENSLTRDFIDEGRGFEEEIESDVNNEGINEPFDPTLIRIDTRQLTIDLVLNRIQYKELDLAPDFQRQAGIWKDDAQSRLIESILIRIPLPAFYMDATNEDKWLVIDGLQRLTALKRFIIEKSLKLTGLEYLKELEDKTYDAIPRKYQRRIMETHLTVYLIEHGTPPEVKYSIFRRINTGGMSLTPQEIRHALNQGKATFLLTSLAKLNEFQKITGMGQSRQQRMLDQEFVLGFLAYTVNPSCKYNQPKSRDELFHRTLAEINKMSEPEIRTLEDKFRVAMAAALEIFGDRAFRKISLKSSKSFPVNQALFEAWSVSLSQLKYQEIEILKQRKDDLINRFGELVDNNGEFLKSISQASEKVNVRFSTIETLIQEVLK